MDQRQHPYPQLEIDLDKLQENLAALKERCQASCVRLCGVVKGFSALPEAAALYEAAGLDSIGSSRLEQLRRLRQAGFRTPLLLIRIPMRSEAEELVKWADISLQSELEVLRAVNQAAAGAGVRHKVILMADLGDLREGFWDREELVSAALEVERELSHLELLGIGTNLGCYGSIQATPEKLEELAAAAEQVEEAIGRRLEVVSGGASSSVHMLLDGTLPRRVNHLRVGELLLLGRVWSCDMPQLHKDVFTLRAEVAEVKTKPSYPVGELSVDAFGRTRTYVDRGRRRRAVLDIGRTDYGECEDLRFREPGLIMLGASSDHTLVDVQDAARPIQVGDVVEFDLTYAGVVYLTHSENVRAVFRRGGKLLPGGSCNAR